MCITDFYLHINNRVQHLTLHTTHNSTQNHQLCVRSKQLIVTLNQSCRARVKQTMEKIKLLVEENKLRILKLRKIEPILSFAQEIRLWT